jgi:hypothetical protein
LGSAPNVATMNGNHAVSAPGLGSDRAVPIEEKADVRWLKAVSRLQRQGHVRDADWDVGYPHRYAESSPLCWTPVSIARRAAAMLSRGPETRVLDVGSGVGKFCTVAALTTPGIFIGVERCGELVDVARATARRAHAPKARFVHARGEDIDWTNFDGFYFFNPYAGLWQSGPSPRYAETLDPAEYWRVVSFTEESLRRARRGARAVTYHGFGGEMPSCFRLIRKDPVGSDYLECWEKR